MLLDKKLYYKGAIGIGMVIVIAIMTTLYLRQEFVFWTVGGNQGVTIYWKGYIKKGFLVDQMSGEKHYFHSQQVFHDVHSSEIDSLKKDTAYSVNFFIPLSSQENISIPSEDTHFSVVIQGDIGTQPTSVMVQDFIAKEKPGLVLGLGDLTYADEHGKKSRDKFLNMIAQSWGNQAPFMPIWGNHEFKDGDDIDYYTSLYSLPNSTSFEEEKDGESWYWFDFGNIRFIAYPEPEYYSWNSWKDALLKEDGILHSAERNPHIKHIIFFGHRSAYSSGKYSGEKELQGIFTELKNEFPKTKLVVSAHAHAYERTKPIDNLTFVVVGTGGEELQANEEGGECQWRMCQKPEWIEQRYINYGFLKLDISPDGIRGVFRCVDDKVYSCKNVSDEFYIK